MFIKGKTLVKALKLTRRVEIQPLSLSLLRYILWDAIPDTSQAPLKHCVHSFHSREAQPAVIQASLLKKSRLVFDTTPCLHTCTPMI